MRAQRRYTRANRCLKQRFRYPESRTRVDRHGHELPVTCEYLRHLSPMRLDFDRPLGLLAPVSAVGFPLAMDAEYVSVTPRAFAGFVVARRDLRQFSAQPTGYEVSFFAPQGLSGAPLVSTAFGAPRCNGYVVQQGTLELGRDVTPVGIAIGIEALLTVQFDGRPLAHRFGREPVLPRKPTQPPFPGGLPIVIDLNSSNKNRNT
jgi:hypothetical protein